MRIYGPRNSFCDALHAQKYRSPGESFREAMTRIANKLSDNEHHFAAFRDILLDMRFMPGGRIQAAIGSLRPLTPYNCYVSGTIEDSYTDGHGSIMARATEAAKTMRLGGGIGYDFSSLRPRGSLIRKLQSKSSGPVSFMEIFDAVCRATASSGHRRGAQMGVLRVDHPDVEEFIRAKQNGTRLTGFNISIGITDEFMRCVDSDLPFVLRWNGTPFRYVDARALWEMIMRSTYDWAEPGVLFIDTINRMNNLYYCENIQATNPCGEQPLPPYGACLLASFNLPAYLFEKNGRWVFNYEQFFLDIPHVVRAMDNVVDNANYPLHEQEEEARRKRRMGLGVTGLANAIEAQGHPYGEPMFLSTMRGILGGLRDTAYLASANLAEEKGSFPEFKRDLYLEGNFIQTVARPIRERIAEVGIRNSHLLSIAPTGTISLCADNISSGIEPVFAYEQQRTIMEFDGPKTFTIKDFGVQYLNVRGKTAADVTVQEHLAVLRTATYFMDSAVSKTCNVPSNYPWEEFKQIYFDAWKAGCKGCTTYRSGGMREAILVSADNADDSPANISDDSCEIDSITGRRSCE